MDKKELIKTLEVDPQKETIFGIIGRMEVVLDFFKKNPEYRSLIPFLETYYLVTKKVAEKRIEQKHFYENPTDLERLDVVFASLYFEPLSHYLKTKKSHPPWAGYFKYCEKDGIPFLEMLLGINAHINADLCDTLIRLKYKNKKDYFLIDNILHEVTPEIMKFLAFSSHDVFGLGGMVFKKIVEEDFYKTAISWRKNAWHNALTISSGSYPEYRNELNSTTEDTCTNLITIFRELRDPLTIPNFNLNLENALVKLD